MEYFSITEDPDKIPDYDPKKKEHFWTLFCLYSVNVEAAIKNGNQGIMDHENLVRVGGPACFHCALAYAREIAEEPCRGS